jgi:hypothetical protein
MKNWRRNRNGGRTASRRGIRKRRGQKEVKGGGRRRSTVEGSRRRSRK